MIAKWIIVWTTFCGGFSGHTCPRNMEMVWGSWKTYEACEIFRAGDEWYVASQHRREDLACVGKGGREE